MADGNRTPVDIGFSLNLFGFVLIPLAEDFNAHKRNRSKRLVDLDHIDLIQFDLR